LTSARKVSRKKYALDEEQKFKAEARRNKLLGLWVAEKARNHGRRRQCLCQGSRRSRFRGKPATATWSARVLGDLTAKGVALTEPQLRVKMDELMAQAIMQVKAGT